MHKKLTKIAAVFALFAFLFLLAPGLSNARPGKFDFRLLIKRPAMWISSFWNLITPNSDDRDNGSKVSASRNSTSTTKTLTESASPKLSKGD